jgi:hypothetical protein
MSGGLNIGYTNANDMARNAAAAAKDPNSGVAEVPPETAAWLAKQGEKILAVAENTNPNGHGHAGVVAPSDQPYDPTLGPMIGQTGTLEATGIKSAKESFIDNGLEPHYYLLPKQ